MTGPVFYARRQFINWRLVQREGVTKPAKMPCDQHGQIVDAQDPANWRTFEDCKSADYGVGVVLTEDDPYFCVDLDGVRCSASGQLTSVATDIVRLLDGAAVEISQSDEGLHIIGRRKADELGPRRNKWSVDGQRIEYYDRARFIAFGVRGFEGDFERDCTAALKSLVPVRTEKPGEALPQGRDPSWCGPDDDDELIKRMRAATGGPNRVVGLRPSFDDLWNADAAALGKFFPSESAPFDGSAADMSLMSMLAFWTGRDAPRMERLFSRSALGARDKWKRPDYRSRTIGKARTSTVTVYSETHRDEARRRAQIEEARRIGADDSDESPLPVVMTLDEMIRDLILIEGTGQIAHVPTKRIREAQHARTAFAASRHIWVDDVGKTKEAPCFPIWMKSPNRKSVDALSWQPGASEFCRPPEITESGERAFNLWKGIKPFNPPDDWQESVKPFQDHVEYLIPLEPERRRFLQWCAHILQRPGELPHTCYLMITPTRGVGRNWLTGMLTRVLRGYVAAGVDLGGVLDGSFNGRLSRKLLATVDETREGLSAKRYERANALQRIVTEEYRLINPKYGHQRLEWNCCRWLMLSNFEDALPFDNLDRRIVVIGNPAERQSPAYYRALYGSQNDPALIASVWQYLSTLDISDFNPGEHAPMNEAKRTALESLESELDRIVREFRDDWPGALCGRSDIRRYASVAMGGQSVDERHLTHAIKRAGMIATGQRVRVRGEREYVLAMTTGAVDAFRDVTPAAIGDLISNARLQFTPE
ncbi:MAG: DUF5906 domain-containing protein [Hyphomonas sp.]